MKVTIRVPDDLYRRLKAESALRGLTVREVTTDLYRRWLSGEVGTAAAEVAPADWLHAWTSAADEAVRTAPRGPSAREELAADRGRLEPG
jgi:hypothetical protein